ncbi:hypothetical protein AVEN_221735-1 [Araneus ventricosus]|uniref:Integrase catalytic domain-containing protein n=1 Tax=Araneus ventricosus TaxID=182803 RepID=A0A4Y2NDD2_ARAVE|nr:hypothetical protein AVEN_86198-1 [Araneus ventricosus]GBN37590.1 hypothetical protein AVEN_221735-1 [Araneus ventricosus]
MKSHYHGFRRNYVGVTSDIEKAFLQISIREEDCDYLRFLWLRKDDLEQVEEYRHRRVVFGLTCSPYLLAATLQCHLNRVQENLSCTSEILKTAFYVDNCVTSLDSELEMRKLILESQIIMFSGNFNLRGWKFNLHSVVPNGDTSTDENMSVLVLVWHTDTDTLSCKVEQTVTLKKPISKRLVLAIAHQIFDPIGFTTPVMLILQEMWNLKLKWDDTLPDDLVRKFKSWYCQLYLIANIRVPRWFSISPTTESLSVHVFCDASQKAYVTCIFLRVTQDATTALCWIQQDQNWGTFVQNRVREICSLTSPTVWRHVPGAFNAADLVSRRCSREQLLQGKWWEGPSWLSENEESWPKSEDDPDEDLVSSEKRKTIVTTLTNSDENVDWYHKYFSSVRKIVHMLAWIFRFYNKLRKIASDSSKTLSISELEKAELALMLLIMKESFKDVNDDKLKKLRPIIDCNGLIRAKTNIFNRDDTMILMTDRVRDAATFGIVGVDLAGPLYLRNDPKAYIVLYTCAVCRAIHLELITSLITEVFLQSLRRFIARRGSPTTIYSDNGTNFKGAERLLHALDWDSILSKAAEEKIQWKFNPLSAAWWGEWGERLVQMMKEILRKTLGRAALDYEELITVLCDCERVINTRPLTYVSKDVDDVSPLTAEMFLREIPESGVDDIDTVDKEKLSKRAKYLQKIREQLGARFQIEYLGQLRQQSTKNYENKPIKVGEIVLLEDGNHIKSNICAAFKSFFFVLRLRYHRGQQIYYEEAGSKNSAVISTINPIEVWVKRTSDNVKYQIYVSELMKGAVTLKRRSA